MLRLSFLLAFALVVAFGKMPSGAHIGALVLSAAAVSETPKTDEPSYAAPEAKAEELEDNDGQASFVAPESRAQSAPPLLHAPNHGCGDLGVAPGIASWVTTGLPRGPPTTA